MKNIIQKRFDNINSIIINSRREIKINLIEKQKYLILNKINGL